MKHNIISIVTKALLRISGQKFPSSQSTILKSLKDMALSACWQITIVGAVAVSGCSSELSGGQDKQAQQEAGDTTAAKPTRKEVGEASWYGPGFQGKETANGETFDQKDMTAAHPTLPMGTKAKVTNLENGKKVEVRINDRGPYADDRVIDLSGAAAKKLDMKGDGTAKVKIETKSTKTK
jgi:rare lipoprotein A (peptidoglycan hydrolase)